MVFALAEWPDARTGVAGTTTRDVTDPRAWREADVFTCQRRRGSSAGDGPPAGLGEGAGYTHALSNMGADGHFGALWRGGKQALARGQWVIGNGGNAGRIGSCARGEIARRFFSRIRKVAPKTDTLVRPGAVISGY